MRRTSRALVLAAALAVLATGCSAGRDGGSAAGADVTGESVAFHGRVLDPVPERPSFVLRDTDGARFDFAAETSGRPTYVYFGYVSCPDECPTAMADVAAALRRSDPALREQARVVFVSTDPERDTPQLVRRFLDQFSTDFIGLVGSEQEVIAAQEAAGVQPALRGEEVPTLPGRPDEHEHAPGTAPHEHFGPLGYAVQHANMIFAYDVSDRLPVVYPPGVLPSDIAADLPALARRAPDLQEPT